MCELCPTPIAHFLYFTSPFSSKLAVTSTQLHAKPVVLISHPFAKALYSKC